MRTFEEVKKHAEKYALDKRGSSIILLNDDALTLLDGIAALEAKLGHLKAREEGARKARAVFQVYRRYGV